MRRAGRDAAFTPIEIVVTGLDPVIHLLRKNLLRRWMDARIKSGHDECVLWRDGALLTLIPDSIFKERRRYT
jgi:hypothetical protein